MTHKRPPDSSGRRSLPRYRSFGAVANLEEHVRPEWWQEIFNSTYLKTDADVVDDPALTQAEADIFVRALSIEPSHRVLDLCCGQGRHALELARRGIHNLDGFDRSRYLIRLARKTAREQGIGVQFREGDARKLPYRDGAFDRVYVAGNSFGFFSSSDDDATVLREIHRVLATGGRVLLDISDGEWVRNNFEPRSWEWIGQRQYVCRERQISVDRSVVTSREMVADVDKGVLVDQFYSARLYSREAIGNLLSSCGFVDIVFFGDYETKSQKNQDLGMMGQRIIVTAQVQKIRVPVNGHAGAYTNGHTNGVHANGRSSPALDVARPRRIRVAVIQGDPTKTDLVKPGGTFDEDDLETIGLLRTALSRLDEYEFTYLDRHDTLLDDLRSNRGQIDLALNLCDEGFQNDARFELHVPALMDILGVPYTGATPQALAHCYDKSLVRGVAREVGVPVADAVFVSPDVTRVGLPFAYPVIVKPNFGDSSVGITQKSVARTEAELLEALAGVRRSTGSGRPVIVERLLTGLDLSVGLMGNGPDGFHVLPVTREDYSALPDGMPRICGYEAKWDPASPYWNILSVPADLPAEVERKLVEQCKLMFTRLGCRDYARFDWRMDSEGTPRLLEVNPNPGWCWDGHLAKMCKLAGLSYPQMLGLILRSAEIRNGLRSPEAGRRYPVATGVSTELTALRAF